MHNSRSCLLKVRLPFLPHANRHVVCLGCLHWTCVSLALAGVNGLRMLGIVHEAVVFLLEQLYGSRHCRSYCFRFHKPEESDEPPINPHGSARAEINHRLEISIAVNIFKQAGRHKIIHVFGSQKSFFGIAYTVLQLVSVCFI